MPTTDTTDARAIRELAARTIGIADLRPGQERAIREVATGRDTLVVMPTGYGKSAVYQIAGHLIDGPTVVVSPLIALQLDQLRQVAEAPGAHAAVAINSGGTEADRRQGWESLRAGDAEFLFLAPEQFGVPEVVERLGALEVGLFVVDEAHCVSAWGHDFRPDYLRLGAVIEALGSPTVLALTATGSAPVREEIVDRLGMRDACVLVGGFDRPNLHLEVVRHETKEEKDAAVLEEAMQAAHPGLVYVATRAQAERMADALGERGLRAAHYHGGLSARRRAAVQDDFQADRLDVVVATNAFGMGIDKPNVRFVLHGDVPESLDAYAQETGRAGRDGDPASVVLHYRPEDLGLRRLFSAGRPDPDRVRRVAAALTDATDPVSVRDLARAADVPTRSAGAIANLLVEAGFARDDRAHVVADASIDAEAADAAVDELIGRRRRVAESRLAMIRGYAETRRCRRMVLLEYFGDDPGAPCGNCDTCDSGAATVVHGESEAEAAAGSSGGPGRSGAFDVDEQVRHAEWGEGRVMSVEVDRITVFFGDEGYRVLALDAVERGGLLARV
ncbi:RecQ family ATP-dependent DNA helicase [Agromyces sp. GXS1127]|uniref:RecQ family ATP-dependent DNA helicase n=1 Tax=Agromyces sp. GXS1127 TaxID=3424181 RepID=UPI003D315D31